MENFDIKVLFTILVDLIHLGDYKLACALLFLFFVWRAKVVKREWFVIMMLLLIVTMFHFMLFKKIEDLQSDIVILQTQVGQTICMNFEDDN